MRHLTTVALLTISALFVSNVTQAQPVSAVETKPAVQNYIVKFNEPGQLYYTGGIQGIGATAPDVVGDQRFDASRSASQSYEAYLLARQSERAQAISTALNRSADVLHNYVLRYSGIALALSAPEAERVRQLPNVASVEEAGIFNLTTDAGPTWIGAAGVWSGASMPNGQPNRGEGTVAGILDGGANSAHPSYANDASCGFGPALPKQISAVDCLATNCQGGTPEDVTEIGHGVHTGSTTAGNRLVPPLTYGGVSLLFEISGVAPCARVRHYKVCGSDTCDGAAIQRAIDQAIVDQVNVVNYSISGGLTPWSNADADRGFLEMVNNQIFVAASAGNTRAATPNPVAAVNHRGPWVMSVANSTHNRIQGNPVSVAGGPQNKAAAASGTPFNTNVTSQVALGISLGSERGCGATSPYPAGSMTGRLALIQRGDCNFTEKAINAQSAGATGIMVYNQNPGPPAAMPALAIPGAMLSDVDGIAVRDFLLANTNAAMTVVGPAQRILDDNLGDILNTSSLRGPNDTFDVTKPDITAPGTNIYAAVSPGAGQFGFLTGTSMSGPHVAGAGALVKSAHPTWTPQEIKSALQLTVKPTGRKDNAVDPWDADDVGNGRVNVGAAVRSGLVMNETFANFLAANPATGGQPRNLNLPSMRHTTCNGSCTFTRVVRNTKTTPATWNAVVSAPPGAVVTVSPSTFSFTGNLAETQSLSITVRINQVGGITATSFGAVTLRDAAAVLPDARMPIAVRGQNVPIYSVAATTSTIQACAGQPVGPIPVTLATDNGFTNAVTLSLFNPSVSFGAGSFSPNPVTPTPAGVVSNLSLSISAAAPSGNANLTVRGTSGANQIDAVIPFRIAAAAPGAFTLTAPANNATNVATNAALTWAASSNADGYVVEISRLADFSAIAVVANVSGTSYTPVGGLRANATYYWRVRAANVCGASANVSGTFSTAAGDTLFSDGFFE